MKCLVDTNIFLEILLHQQRQQDAKDLLSTGHVNQRFITDFSLHSIGVLLFRQKHYDIFTEFITDMLIRAGIRLKTIRGEALHDIVKVARKFELDFDDAYQYIVAAQGEMHLVSFDADFDRTDRGRSTPLDILDSLQDK